MMLPFTAKVFGSISIRLRLWGCLVIVSFLALSSLGCQQEATYETISEATLKPGDVIPAPSEEIVLTILGNLSNPNRGDKLVFDLPTLEKLGLVQYTVPDPWLQRDVTYTGVFLSDVMKAATVSDSITGVYVVALDGYNSDIPVADIEDWPVILATQSDGQYMTIENSGPTRIIYPYDTYPNITDARNRSVWNIERLEIK